jgi:hypothetical protein
LTASSKVAPATSITQGQVCAIGLTVVASLGLSLLLTYTRGTTGLTPTALARPGQRRRQPARAILHVGSKRLGGKEVKNMFTVKPGAL